MGSHCVHCHLAVVMFQPLPRPKLLLNLATLAGCKAELTWWWLHVRELQNIFLLWDLFLKLFYFLFIRFVNIFEVWCDHVDDWSDKASENSSTNDEGSGGGMEADSDAAASASSQPKKPAKTQHVTAVRKNHLNIVFIGHVGKLLHRFISVGYLTKKMFKMSLAAIVVMAAIVVSQS